MTGRKSAEQKSGKGQQGGAQQQKNGRGKHGKRGRHGNGAQNAQQKGQQPQKSAQNAQQQFAINQFGNAKNTLTQGYGDATIAGMNNRTAGLQSQANALAGAQNAMNQQTSILGQLAGPAAEFLGSYFGAKS